MDEADINTDALSDGVVRFERVRVIRMPRGDKTFPALVCAADAAPATGTEIEVKPANGVTYRGIVHDATVADGEVLIELQDGLTPA